MLVDRESAESPSSVALEDSAAMDGDVEDAAGVFLAAAKAPGDGADSELAIRLLAAPLVDTSVVAVGGQEAAVFARMAVAESSWGGRRWIHFCRRHSFR